MTELLHDLEPVGYEEFLDRCKIKDMPYQPIVFLIIKRVVQIIWFSTGNFQELSKLVWFFFRCVPYKP